MDEYWHGTQNGYGNRGCRCDPCRLAHNEYFAEYHRNRRKNFVPDESTPHGINATYTRGCRCDECKLAHRIYSYEHRYLDVDYDALNSAQDGLCAICGRKPASNLVVDHDHATGVVRGLLCHACNTALGKFQDSPEILQRAIEYISTV